MSSQASSANDLLVEHYARSTDTCEMSNGRRGPTIGTSDAAENHKDSRIDRGPTSSLRLSKHGLPRSPSKKSLSFFPSVEYSEESSNEVEGSKANNNSSAKQQICLNERVSLVRDDTETSLIKEVVQVRSSDHDDASSTSSCSCEDHSSVASHSGEDLHGDLDYDDDDGDDEDDKMKNTASHSRRSTGELQENEGKTDAAGHDTITNDLSIGNKFSAATNDDKDVFESTQANYEEVDMKGDKGLCGDEPTKKISSFINFDHGHDDDNDASKTSVSIETKKSFKDRSHKSYRALLKYFFKDACYFQIKSINHENVALSKSLGVWSTPTQNELRLNAAFREHRNVILIFSVQQSGAFQGFARMVSESQPTQEPVPWVLPERLSNAALGGVIRLEWLCTKELNFNETRDLYNAFNSNKPIKVARDGQQVEPRVGRKLCTLFPKDSKDRLLASVETLKNQSRQRKQLLKESSYYPLNDIRTRNGVMRRSRNGLHSRLDSTVVNGFSDANSDNPIHEQYHQFYAQSGPYGPGNVNRESIGLIRRGGSMNQMMHPSHFHRSRPFPIHGLNAYQRPSHHNHHAPVLSSAHSNVHGEFYPGLYGPNCNPYLDPMHHPEVLDQHSRSYNDWAIMDMNQQIPYRYHPYHRQKR